MVWLSSMVGIMPLFERGEFMIETMLGAVTGGLLRGGIAVSDAV